MKKNDLIKLLQRIQGNPDVVLWNGLVGDYQNISTELVEDYLTKSSKEHYLRMVEFEKKRDKNDWNACLTKDEINECLKYYNKQHYEYTHYGDQSFNKKKRVVFIQPTIRNEIYTDRLGSVKY